jgi:hypothetical protein
MSAFKILRRERRESVKRGRRCETSYLAGDIFPALKFPRQCPLILLVTVRLIEGKALGSERGTGLECGAKD